MTGTTTGTCADRTLAGTAGACVGVLLRVAGAGLLVGLAAQVRILLPGTPVPVTLQLLAVLLVGFMLRPVEAAAAIVLYLGLGTAGLPVFAPGSGGVVGPTGGYLVAFPLAAWLVSLLRGKNEVSLWRLLAAGGGGIAVVFICGVLWLAVYVAGDVGMAMKAGFWPFAGLAIVELAAAVAFISSVRRVGPCGQTFPEGLQPDR